MSISDNDKKYINTYFSAKQQNVQVNKIFNILKIQQDQESLRLCGEIVKKNNYLLYEKYRNKKPVNITLKTFLQKLNHKSTIDSAQMFHNVIQVQNSKIKSNDMNGSYATIDSIGTSILNSAKIVNNGNILNKPIPTMSRDAAASFSNINQSRSIEEGLKQRELEDRLFNINLQKSPINTDPSQFLVDDPEGTNKKILLDKMKQQANNQYLNTPTQINQPVNTINNNAFEGFLATDIINSPNQQGANINESMTLLSAGLNGVNMNQPQNLQELKSHRDVELRNIHNQIGQPQQPVLQTVPQIPINLSNIDLNKCTPQQLMILQKYVQQQNEISRQTNQPQLPDDQRHQDFFFQTRR